MMFSIIVPIYNIEKYLPECIESVLNQKYSDYELILVDDGSPDNCPEICDKYSKDNKNIVVIHQENAGLSAARNTGIKIAKGDYIIFLDGDDVLCDNILEHIYSDYLKKGIYDVLIGNVLHWFDDKEIVYFNNKQLIEYSQEHTIFELCEKYAENDVLIPWRAWQSVYRADFIKSNSFFFDSEIIGAEDCDFFFRVISCIENYVLSEYAVVKYRAFREGSIINAPSYKSVIGQLKVFKNLYDSATVFTNYKLMRRYFADKFTNIVILIEKLSDVKQKEICLEFVKENNTIIRHSSNKLKYIVAKLCWFFLGYKLGNKFLLKFHK